MKTGYIFILLLLVSSCSPVPADLSGFFPENVGQVKLVELITGDEALFAVEVLHSKSIAGEDAAIGQYEGKGGSMTVWISRAVNVATAREQAALMVERMMRNPNTPFSEHSSKMRNGVEVHKVLGMGQVHLIFFHKVQVYWISVETGNVDVALDAFLGSD